MDNDMGKFAGESVKFDTSLLGECVRRVRETAPLVHCITNYVTVNDCANALVDDPFVAEVAAIAGEGLAGEIAAARMGELDGNGSFRTYLLDAIYNLSPEQLVRAARVEWVV